VKPPDVQYARSGELSIAYQVVGEGPLDFVFVPPISHLELAWESPAQAQFFDRLASLSRLIMLNQRGVGMSDRVPGVPTLEMRMDDIHAVMDAVGSERATLFGLGDAGPLCVLFAATYPERTSGLVLMNSSPRFVRNPELPWLPTRAEADLRARELERRWGEPAFMNKVFLGANPSASEEEARSIARVLRVAVSPGSAAAYVRMNDDIDVCEVLPSIRVPTLVLQREEAPWDARSSRYLADHVSGARLVELPGADFVPFLGDQQPLFAELEAFLAEASEGRQWQAEPDRVLATVLFTDIVGATARAAELRDRAWRALLEKHHAEVRRQLSRFRGEEIDTAGDGFFATFDGPARAIRCACAVRDALAELGLDVRAGLHAGECEIVDGKVSGIAVHTGARVAAQAGPGEVLVSSTVKDLVAGSELEFEARGVHELKGIPGEWRLYAVRDPESDRTSRSDAFEGRS
jgi:class 3 adenylate cyclase/pimeloyl-ACP methyl ester carboxylesterase